MPLNYSVAVFPSSQWFGSLRKIWICNKELFQIDVSFTDNLKIMFTKMLFELCYFYSYEKQMNYKYSKI